MTSATAVHDSKGKRTCFFRKLHNLQSFFQAQRQVRREGGGGHGCAVNLEQGEMQRCVAANTPAGEKPRLEKAMGVRRFRGITLSIEQLKLGWD